MKLLPAQPSSEAGAPAHQGHCCRISPNAASQAGLVPGRWNAEVSPAGVTGVLSQSWSESTDHRRAPLGTQGPLSPPKAWHPLDLCLSAVDVTGASEREAGAHSSAQECHLLASRNQESGIPGTRKKALLIFDPCPSQSLGPPFLSPAFLPCWPLLFSVSSLPWHPCSDQWFLPQLLA